MKEHRGILKSFAIVYKNTGTFFTMERAVNIVSLIPRYPINTFLIYDMSGNDDIPNKKGAFINDLTVNSAGKWEWKLTDEDITNRKNNSDKLILQESFISLKLKKDVADSLGAEYEELANILQERINKTITAIAEI